MSTTEAKGLADKPWASGAVEILRHALSLLAKDSDTNRRLAMILVDNSVEQALKTYLGLPKRLNGLSITRKRLDEISESYPALLDAVEEFASDRIVGIDLGAVEWYHRIRNELYHQGVGLTVEREKVHVYSQLAIGLIKSLFDVEVVPPTEPKPDLTGQFIQLWIKLERALAYLAGLHRLTGEEPRLIADSLNFLRSAGLMTAKQYSQIRQFRDIRNKLVHGVQPPEGINPELIAQLQALVSQWQEPE